MSVYQTRERISSTEFLKWIWFLEWKATEEFDRKDFYLAQIAAEIVRGQVKKPKKIKLKDFLLDFKKEKAEPSKEQMQRSKKFWLGAVGVIGKKQNRQKRTVPKVKE